MRLCEFVFWSLLPDEPGNGTRFQQVLEDEVRMSAVFEDFLRNFYQLHRTDYSVRAESLDWDVTEATEYDLALLPRMVTDITLRHPNHTIVIDAKFYKKSLVESPYGERVQSQHLYQLVTYLQHARIRHRDKGLSGMLIYPQVDRPLRLRYRLLGIPVMVATVDLSLEWRKIEAELRELLDECASAATGLGSIVPAATALVLTESAADVY
jgi:5-methylcytosine-specific restriction enzyme subunit McrC